VNAARTYTHASRDKIARRDRYVKGISSVIQGRETISSRNYKTDSTVASVPLLFTSSALRDTVNVTRFLRGVRARDEERCRKSRYQVHTCLTNEHDIGKTNWNIGRRMTAHGSILDKKKSPLPHLTERASERDGEKRGEGVGEEGREGSLQKERVRLLAERSS